MKHAQLCAIAHNLADSVASGISFIIGCYTLDIFGEAARSKGGVIAIDFLSGTIIQGEPSPSLEHAAKLYAAELPNFCRKNGASAEDFTKLTAAFSSGAVAPLVTVTVIDSDGRESEIDYAGNPLKRPRVLDPIGRIRRAPTR